MVLNSIVQYTYLFIIRYTLYYIKCLKKYLMFYYCHDNKKIIIKIIREKKEL